MMPSRVSFAANVIGLLWFITICFLSTIALAHDESDETVPLPLVDSVMYEQFDQGSLYKTHFEFPYKQHLCQPRKIHLSPASDIDIDSGLYNATVSFTLNLKSASSMIQDGNGDLVRTRLAYGRGDTTEGSVLIEYEDGDYFENTRKKITEEYTLLRFNYTSPTTKKYYESDLIHHILLKDLQAGRKRYWYSIQVEIVEGILPNKNQALRPFFPPLMPPVKKLYASQYWTTRFFLRGSYFKNKNHEPEQSQTQRKEQKAAVIVIGETPLYEFTTPPLYGTPTSIALVGDLGQTKNSTRTMARILGASRPGSYEATRINPSIDDYSGEDSAVTNLFIAGDLSYADGDPERWESWLDLAEPLLREVPFASVPGNHEVECDKITHDVFVPYESFFRNPNRIQEAVEHPPSWHLDCTAPSEFIGRYDYGNAYFSHKQGLVHTIFLNAYASLLDGSKQREWLINTALPRVDRSLTPWLVVIFHTPLYTTFSNHYGELNPTVMKASGLRQVFENYKVNLVVSGHDHAYMRTKALDSKGRVAKNGAAPIFWTLGAGGNREGHARYRNPNEAEDWVAKRDNDEYGFGLFFAPNRTHAHLQWMRDDDNHYENDDDHHSLRPDNSSLVVRDSVWIENYYFDSLDFE